MSLYKMWVTMTVAFLFLSCSILKFVHNKKKGGLSLKEMWKFIFLAASSLPLYLQSKMVLLAMQATFVHAPVTRKGIWVKCLPTWYFGWLTIFYLNLACYLFHGLSFLNPPRTYSAQLKNEPKMFEKENKTQNKIFNKCFNHAKNNKTVAQFL